MSGFHALFSLGADMPLLGYGGMLLGPVVVGFVAHVTTLSVSLSLLAVLALAAAFLAPYLREGA